MSNTIRVPREEVERLIKLLRYTAHPMPSPHAEHWEALLKAAPASTGAEPVAWMQRGELGVFVTASEKVVSDWQGRGEPYIPLYTHSPAQDEVVRLNQILDRLAAIVEGDLCVTYRDCLAEKDFAAEHVWQDIEALRAALAQRGEVG